MTYRPQGHLATTPDLEVMSPRFVYRSVVPNEPQLFVDDYLVDNRFDEDLLSARVPHVLHPPQRPDAPILSPDGAHPWEWGGLTWPPCGTCLSPGSSTAGPTTPPRRSVG